MKAVHKKNMEEVEIIKAKYDALLGQEFTDREGAIHPIAQYNILVVANPKLLEISCGTGEQIKLANTFCLLDEYAESGTNT